MSLLMLDNFPIIFRHILILAADQTHLKACIKFVETTTGQTLDTLLPSYRVRVLVELLHMFQYSRARIIQGLAMCAQSDYTFKHEEKKIESSIQHYIRKDPQDRFAFMKGLVAANKAKIFKNFLVKILRIVTLDWTTPFLITETTNWIQQTEPEPWVQSLRMIALACCLPLLKFVWHVIQEYINFEMIEMGHRNHTALKVILFRKNMKMTSATSGEFSTGEIHSIVMNDSNLIWSFIWELPGLIECPLRILVSSYFVIKYLGWSGLIVILAMVLQSVLEYIRSKTGSNDDDKRRELNTKRALQINESFNNIKSVKLFGWEGKFIDSIQSIYKKQQELDD